MCPFCLSTLGLIVAGAVTTGGIAALVVKVSRQENGAKATLSESNREEDPNANEHNRKPESSVAE